MVNNRLEHEPVDTAILTFSPPSLRSQVPATEFAMLQAAEKQSTPLTASIDVQVDAASISLPDVTPEEEEDLVNYTVHYLTSRRHVRS
jgi:hypothetical protein